MYKIIDEPMPGNSSRLAVNPIWPFFALLFGGAWIAFPWFILNSFFIGCPNRIKTILISFTAFVGSTILFLIINHLASTNVINSQTIEYTFISFVVWKIGITYYLYSIQSRSFQIFNYFEQTANNGIIVVIASLFIKSKVLSLFDNVFWVILMD